MNGSIPPVDGVTEVATSSQQPLSTSQPEILTVRDAVSPEEKARMKRTLLIAFSIPYVLFVFWCFFLMTVLPSASGAYESLILPGIVSSSAGALVFLLLGSIALKRIFEKKHISSSVRGLSIARICLIMLPGIVIGGLVPAVITGEPRLSIIIQDPDPGTELIAPLALTYSAEPAIEILRRRGLRVIEYSWDFDGDRIANQTTATPTATAVYDRAGIYNVAVVLSLSDNTKRVVPYRLVISNQTFSVNPSRVIVDEPVTFSIAHLFDTLDQVREVHWDFDNDGIIDEVSNKFEVTHSYVRTGAMTVSALLVLSNQVQQRLEKVITIEEPPPLPFPIHIETEPDYLFSPPPFGVIFKVVSDEDLREILWDYGDGDTAQGERVKHTFRTMGDFTVKLEARSSTGERVKLTEKVRVVPRLSLPDLAFNGTPNVDLRTRTIRGEVPLKIDITPRTATPLVEFFWEAPDATVVGSTDTILQAIYRRPGNYIVTLVAQDPEGHTLRLPINIEVTPPSENVSIRMTPEGGVAPQEVQFDASETFIPGEDISGFEWEFGDGNGVPQQGGAVMIHTFVDPGTYEVKLSARTTMGNVYSDSNTIVIREPLLSACFEASRFEGKAPLGINFDMSCTTGIASKVEWDFGDGVLSEKQKPQHVFESAGTYQVTLKVTNQTGKVSIKQAEITAFNE